MTACAGPGEKSRNRSSCPRMAATLCSRVGTSSRLRSDERPDGSPIIPVPPPTSATGRPPCRCSRSSPKMGIRCPMWSESAVGIEPDVGADPPPGRQALRQARRRGLQDAPPAQVVEEPRQVRCVLRGASAVMRASHGTDRDRPRSGPDRSIGFSSPAWYRSARNADQPLPEAAPTSPERQAPPAWQRCRQVRGARHPALPVHHHRPVGRCGCDDRRRRLLVPLEGPAGPQEDPRGHRVRPADGRVGPDRQGPAGPPRLRPPGARDLRPDPAGPRGRDDRDRGQDVLGELGLRSHRVRGRGHRHDPGQRPRRLHDHPAARASPAPARRVRSRTACTSARRARSSSRSA